jgi:hypothetical protein
MIHPIYFSLHIGYHFLPMNRKLALFLLICFLLSILELVFHHHEDGVSHDNCSICSYVSHHSFLIPQDSPQISLLSSNILLVSLEGTVNSSFPSYHPYSNRAPPL